jgi:hypothetical protein
MHYAIHYSKHYVFSVCCDFTGCQLVMLPTPQIPWLPCSTTPTLTGFHLSHNVMAATPGHCLPPSPICPQLASTDCLQPHSQSHLLKPRIILCYTAPEWTPQKKLPQFLCCCAHNCCCGHVIITGQCVATNVCSAVLSHVYQAIT